MGNFHGLVTKGLPSWRTVTDKIYENYDIVSEDTFYEAILDVFNKINSSFPGMRYDAPTYDEVQKYFNEKVKDETEVKKKKELFQEFLVQNIGPSKRSPFTIMAGVSAPPAAMILKKAGESLPLINMIRYIPDYVFVPGTTVVALFVTKFIEHRALSSVSS